MCCGLLLSNTFHGNAPRETAHATNNKQTQQIYFSVADAGLQTQSPTNWPPIHLNRMPNLLDIGVLNWVNARQYQPIAMAVHARVCCEAHMVRTLSLVYHLSRRVV